MISELDDLGQVSMLSLQGPARAESTALVVTAAVMAVDVAKREVQVRISDSAVWLPAQPGRYLVGSTATEVGLARVMVDPIAGRPVMVLGPVNGRATILRGEMTAVGGTTTAPTCTVRVDDITSTLPYLPGTYGTFPRAVWVSTDDWGVPILVHGPVYIDPPTPPPPPPPPTPPAPPVIPPALSTVQASATIGPQWSDTWRTSRAKWGSWNAGTGLLFQGNGYGSGGTVIGLATYGDQITNLGASSIQGILLKVWRSDGGANAPTSLVLQGTSQGSQPSGAPTPSGETVTVPSVGVGGWAEAWLPTSIVEGMRTGAIKGLAAVGGIYSGWGGSLTAGSMVLTVNYTRPA